MYKCGAKINYPLYSTIYYEIVQPKKEYIDIPITRLHITLTLFHTLFQILKNKKVKYS